ncbi:MAG: hypothetical protein WC699_02470 [Bacteroidales bacterium]|jgi:hypothetical protein
MIKLNLLEPELIRNFVPLVEMERRQKADRFLLYTIGFFVAGMAAAWVVSAVYKLPDNQIPEEEKKNR